MKALLLVVACATAFSATAGELSSEKQWQELQQMAANFDITAASGTRLVLSSGGTSVYAEIHRGGRPIGAVIPANAASKLSGEVMSYTVARLLGVSDLYQGGIYVRLSGANLQAFSAMVPRSALKNKIKENNRREILKRIAANPGGIDAIFKKWDAKPAAYNALVGGNKLSSSHVLKGSKRPFASFLQCEGPQPSKSVTVTMNGGTTTEWQAARELSSILLIDALMQQWDRYSGGNLQTVTTKDGRVYFAAFDNGGTWSSPWTARNLDYVSRFDPEVARRLLELNRFVNLGGSEFLGLRTEQELIQVLNAEHFPDEYAILKQTLAKVAKHIEANRGCEF